ncbi:MAG TPA: enoyl-CoA hydratase/isomerase family protein [Myxococcota bacterium]|nr:enoyl-CoA hydratase/isomerase family protein [Myxococcota bacterium]
MADDGRGVAGAREPAAKGGGEPAPDGGEPDALPLVEACERLASPWASDSFSAACGQPWVAVELAGAAPSPDAADALRRGLAELPCPSFAIVPERGAPAARELADAFDVVLEPGDALAPLVEAVKRAPLAAAALAQLLRGGEARSVEQGLVAESSVYSMLQAGPEFAAWLASQPTLRPEIPESPPLVAAREGAQLELVLANPAKRNAYSAELRDRLCEALQLAVADEAIEEIVLRGEGPAFCAGGDLDEFGLLVDPATAHAIRTTRSAARLLARCAGRVRAEIHGACVGAGIELPAFAGRVVARSDAWMQLPELAMGLVPGAGGTVSLPRRIGRQRTAWLALSGARVGAETAASWGLVDEIVS